MSAGPRIAVVDYGAGNLVSIDQALRTVGAEVEFARDGEGLRGVDAVMVPGVGAAAPAMARLESQGLAEPIRAWLAAGRPFLGICLGLQLLFDGSDEGGATTLGIVPGRTVRLEGAPTLPHIGWNQVDRTRPHALFDGIADGADFYFVHSYAGTTGAGPGPEPGPAATTGPTDRDLVLATTEHGGTFISAVARGAMLGVQFHPERSGRDGLRLLANFVDIVRAA
jgi:imidazole glycerol phosphate synthase glutamine amidotransferase subunit